METTQRAYFKVLCETGNITKAAEQLCVARQTLSLSMKKLEEELGGSLFVREKNGVSLTDYGRRLLDCIVSQDRLWEDFRGADAKSQADEEIIRVGLSGVGHNPSMYSTIYSFAQRETRENHRVTVDIVSKDLPDYLQMLHSGFLDFAVTYYLCPDDYRGLRAIPLVEDDPQLIVGRTSPLADLKVVDFLADLRGQTLLYEGHYLPEGFREQCEKLGISNRSVSFSRSVIENMIAHNHACLYMPLHACPRFASERTCYRPLVNMDLDIQPKILYRPDIGTLARRLADEVYRYYTGEESGPFAS